MIVGASYYDHELRGPSCICARFWRTGSQCFSDARKWVFVGQSQRSFRWSGWFDRCPNGCFFRCDDQQLLAIYQSRFCLSGSQTIAARRLYATGKIATTVEGVDIWWSMAGKAAEAVGAVSGNNYVKLNRGLLTVDQINYFLDSMPMELTFADSNNQFLYYNLREEAQNMLAARVPGQVGNPLAKCHPENPSKMLSGWSNSCEVGRPTRFGSMCRNRCQKNTSSTIIKRCTMKTANMRGSTNTSLISNQSSNGICNKPDKTCRQWRRHFSASVLEPTDAVTSASTHDAPTSRCGHQRFSEIRGV